MREILFKGKSLETGKWVQGYLFKHWGKAFILWGTNNGQPTMNEVNPNTVGQYTGLKNKNGTKIFEGDIVKHDQYVTYYELHTFKGVVSIDSRYGVMVGNNSIGEISEIIGNIHDDPELLEVEE